MKSSLVSPTENGHRPDRRFRNVHRFQPGEGDDVTDNTDMTYLSCPCNFPLSGWLGRGSGCACRKRFASGAMDEVPGSHTAPENERERRSPLQIAPATPPTVGRSGRLSLWVPSLGPHCAGTGRMRPSPRPVHRLGGPFGKNSRDVNRACHSNFRIPEKILKILDVPTFSRRSHCNTQPRCSL